MSIIIRYPKLQNQNYLCADATWHTLLTVQAYRETPINVHLLLPIVSLSQQEDKGISWGATIPDNEGNYYYTSFSSLGFAAPWAFIKIFNLPNNEQSLYLLNSLLYLVSFLLLYLLLYKLFAGKLSNSLIVIISSTYLFQPEILHSQGIVYWHQSLFQVLLLGQLLLFLDLRGKFNTAIFFVLCLVAPYLEWTGYLSNIGFSVAFCINGCLSLNKQNITVTVKSLLLFIGTVLVTFVSGIIFVKHYLAVVSGSAFVYASIARFASRTGHNLAGLINGYFESFGVLIIVVIVLLAVCLVRPVLRTQLILSLHKVLPILFVSLFSCLENIVMMQHAIQYTFDRIKVIIPIIILICLCISVLWQSAGNVMYRQEFIAKRRKILSIFAVTAILSISSFSFVCYITDKSHWKWDAPYLANNQVIAKQLTNEYTRENSIYATNVAVRGYANMLFERGIYERCSVERAIQIAEEKGKRYAVIFQIYSSSWNMYDFRNYIIFDTTTGKFK
jgi:hypothetical protein